MYNAKHCGRFFLGVDFGGLLIEGRVPHVAVLYWDCHAFSSQEFRRVAVRSTGILGTSIPLFERRVNCIVMWGGVVVEDTVLWG